MDTIIAIFATVLANAVVTGIIVHRFQKRFEAKLQFSNFEQQTKFARLHAKRMEVLENWYQKFREFEDALNKWIAQLQHAKEESAFDITDESRAITAKWEEFEDYYEANILFIPYSLLEKMGEVRTAALYLQLGVHTLAKTPTKKLLDNGLVGEIRAMLRIENEDDLTTPGKFLSALQTVLHRQSRIINNLYKSVAEVDYDKQYRSHIEYMKERYPGWED